MIGAEIPQELHTRLTLHAARENRPIAEILREWLEPHLQRLPKTE